MNVRKAFQVVLLAVPAMAGVIHSPRWVSQQRDSAQIPFDWEDLSGIKKLAAVGDSYSAGIGAGDRLGSETSNQGAWLCSRYSNSYPALINNHTLLGNAQEMGRTFEFESCSGALTHDVINDQLPRISGNQDVILLSAGGNDAELVHVLNQCVFQIFAPTDIMSYLLKAYDVGKALQAIGGNDLYKYSRGCEGQLDDSEKIIDSPEFSQAITSTINAALAKLSDMGTIYYTGYAKFWDERATDNDWCSAPEHSWSLYLTKITDYSGLNFQKPVVLTRDRRMRMNAMVDKVNGKIKDAVTAAGDRVVFVDWDPYVDLMKGGFCAPGVEEPAPTKFGLLFYELDVEDAMGTTPFKRTDADAADGTFEGALNLMAELAYTAGLQFKDGTLEPSNNTATFQKRGTLLPDGYGRIFHPQAPGHQVIANLVTWHMMRRRSEANKVTFPAEMVADDDPCPFSNPLVRPNPICDKPTELSGVFYNAFMGGPYANTYDKFCKRIEDQYSTHQETVDIEGDRADPRSKLMKRTPPPNIANYDNYIFELSWVPDKDSRNCLVDCGAAFKYLTNSYCGHQGAQQNVLTTEASIDVGCGNYSWKITDQGTPPPSMGKQYCNDATYGVGSAIIEEEMFWQVNLACQNAPKTITSDMSSSATRYLARPLDGIDHPYFFTIGWREHCTSTVTEPDPRKPLPDNADVTCESLLTNNWKNCNNGGRGGFIDVGCVTYSSGSN